MTSSSTTTSTWIITSTWTCHAVLPPRPVLYHRGATCSTRDCWRTWSRWSTSRTVGRPGSTRPSSCLRKPWALSSSSRCVIKKHTHTKHTQKGFNFFLCVCFRVFFSFFLLCSFFKYLYIYSYRYNFLLYFLWLLLITKKCVCVFFFRFHFLAFSVVQYSYSFSYVGGQFGSPFFFSSLNIRLLCMYPANVNGYARFRCVVWLHKMCYFLLTCVCFTYSVWWWFKHSFVVFPLELQQHINVVPKCNITRQMMQLHLKKKCLQCSLQR